MKPDNNIEDTCTLSLGTADGRSLILLRLCSYVNKSGKLCHTSKEIKFRNSSTFL